ncbi:hypothetical protein E2P81_ATG10356 [Venturia nashicola]|nr:hypothetical protein E2P81_ATG10356 [Venturia nashicola]
METAKPAAELSAHDLSVIQEAKALIEKLNSVMQSAEHQPLQLEPTPPNDDHDTASNFSGYSMLTPSADTRSDGEEGKSLTGQQILPEPCVEEDVVSYGPQLEPSADEFVIDASNDMQQCKDSVAADSAPLEEIVIPQEECEPANQKHKLVGIVINLGPGIDSEQGEKALRFIGDYLDTLLGPWAEQLRLLSFHGHGPLEVALAPQPEPESDSVWGLGRPDGLVATIHWAKGVSKQQTSTPKDAPAMPADDFGYVPDLTDLLPPVPSKTETLLTKRIELVEARTLRALIGSRESICSCNGFPSHTEKASKNPSIGASKGSPKLSELIGIAKTKVQRELKAACVHHTILPNTKETRGVPESTRSFPTQLWGTKSMVLMRGKGIIIASLIALCLSITLLVLGSIGLNTQSRSHCVGFMWKA